MSIESILDWARWNFLGWIFLALMVAVTTLVLRNHGLFYGKFGTYLLLYSIAHPLYLAGMKEWYWCNILTCVALWFAVGEAIQWRLVVMEDEGRRQELRYVRMSAAACGVLLAGFVLLLGKMQFNVNGPLHTIWELSLAFCIGRSFIVWLYGVVDSTPCMRGSNMHLFLLMMFLIPSLIQLTIRIGPEDQELYWKTRLVQTTVRIGVLLGWLGMFWRVKKRTNLPVQQLSS